MRRIPHLHAVPVPVKMAGISPGRMAFVPPMRYSAAMGLAYATLRLSNPKLPHLLPITVQSLADTGALHLCVPSHVALQLKLDELQKREVVTADGKKILCAYVGPVEVSYDGRSCFTGAVVLGDEV